ncbi:bacteriocin immunity protein [Pseudomonas sp. v388]|uniref:bacteriocin immunity protein n=1 Tax=Pseudomonas sp. v388 TaxID=2479849 RepID=UPI000F773B19|nr:bacteriocin immunity protein [Pseudomonas sp. v388]RRV05523.1 bacteriocin immunity protein [Pseudomonas sp. v388]
MAELKKRFEDYTELEFTSFLKDIFLVNSRSEAEHNSWVRHFREVTEYPRGTDILFYPLPGADCSPEGVIKTVKQWRAENGKPGFKTE